MAGEKPRLQFSRRKASKLIRAGLPLAVSQLVLLATWHGDYIIVQSQLDTETLGLYFLAFTLATQFFSLASRSVSRVLFVGLSHLSHDPARQTAAFFRAAGDLACFAFPISFLQVLLAEPAVTLLFPEHFASMAGTIAILSIGLAFRSVGSPAGALLQARRKFKRLLLINSIYSAFFLSVVYFGTRFFGVTGTATAVTTYFIFLGPIHILVSVPSARQSLYSVFRLFFAPCVCSSAALAIGLLSQWSLDSVTPTIVSATLSLFVFASVYFIIGRLLLPQALEPVVQRVSSIWSWALSTISREKQFMGGGRT